jgi:hypothetical protein
LGLTCGGRGAGEPYRTKLTLYARGRLGGSHKQGAHSTSFTEDKVDIHFNNVKMTSDMDIDKIARELTRKFEREVRSSFQNRNIFP